MTDPAWQLQQALFAKLTQALDPVKVLDAPPQGTAYPYVVIGEDSSADWSCLDRDGEDILATIHVWSQYQGHKEAKNLIGKVKVALRDWAPALPGPMRMLPLRFVSSLVIDDPDGKTRHGVVRFRALFRA